jgi:hypothetical protein
VILYICSFLTLISVHLPGSIYILVLIAISRIRDALLRLSASQMMELCNVIQQPDGGRVSVLFTGRFY